MTYKGPIINYVREEGWVGGKALCSKTLTFYQLGGQVHGQKKDQKFPYVIDEQPKTYPPFDSKALNPLSDISDTLEYASIFQV